MQTAILAADATEIIADQTKVNEIMQAAMQGAWELLFAGADGDAPDFFAMVVRPALGIALFACAIGFIKIAPVVMTEPTKLTELIPIMLLCLLLMNDGFLLRTQFLAARDIIYIIDDNFAEKIGGEAQAWFEREKQVADDVILEKIQSATAACDRLLNDTDEQKDNQKACYQSVNDFIKANIGSINNESIKVQIEALQDAIDEQIGGGGISFGDLSGLLTSVTEGLEEIIRWVLRVFLVGVGLAISIMLDLGLLVTGIISPLFIAPAFFDRSFVGLWVSGVWAVALAKWSLRIMVGVVQIYSTKAQLGVGIVDSAYPFLGEILLGICAPFFAIIAGMGGGMAGLQVGGGAMVGASKFLGGLRGSGKGGGGGGSTGGSSTGGGSTKPNLVVKVRKFKRPKSV